MVTRTESGAIEVIGRGGRIEISALLNGEYDVEIQDSHGESVVVAISRVDLIELASSLAQLAEAGE